MSFLIYTIAVFIPVLGLLIFVHELGHFLVAKRAGVKVLKFSLGFGPTLIGTKKGDTEYVISAIPLGGYVKMLGEDTDDEVSPDQMERSFAVQPVLKRIAIVFAGPFMNLLLAAVIFIGVGIFVGIPNSEVTTEIGAITSGSAAEKAGLKPGDTIVSIDGKKIDKWEDVFKTIEEVGERPVPVAVIRDKESLTITATPTMGDVKNFLGIVQKDESGNPLKRPLLGIAPAHKITYESAGLLDAIEYGFVKTYEVCALILTVIVKLFQGEIPRDTIGGPIQIAMEAGKHASKGMLDLLFFVAMISINLAMLNLLPIPVLDGGHIFFFALEGILGRPVSVKKVEIAQKVGLALLLLLMVFAFYNDIMRLIR